MIADSKVVGKKTKVRGFKTENGIKDTYLDRFLGRMFNSHKGLRGKDVRQCALDTYCETLPATLISPVWRIEGALLTNTGNGKLKQKFPQASIRTLTHRSRFCIPSFLASSSTFGETRSKTKLETRLRRGFYSKPGSLRSIHLAFVEQIYILYIHCTLPYLGRSELEER